MSNQNNDNFLEIFPADTKIGELLAAVPAIAGMFSPKAASKLTKRRIDSLLAIIRAADEKLNQADVTDRERKYCSLKLGIPLIESASLEEDPKLQELWANLLANLLNPAYTDEIRTLFIDIIKKLTPLDAAVLNAYGNNKLNNYLPFRFVETEDGYCKSELWTSDGYIEIDTNKTRESFLVLRSLSLMDNIKTSSSVFSGGGKILSQSDYYLTGLGHSFFKACLVDAGQYTKSAAFQKSSTDK